MARSAEFHAPQAAPKAAGAHKWMLAFAIILLLATGAFFQSDEASSYVYGIVLLFAVVALSLPWLMWRINRSHPEAHPEATQTDPEAASHHQDEGLGDAIMPVAAVSLGSPGHSAALHDRLAPLLDQARRLLQGFNLGATAERTSCAAGGIRALG